MAELNMSEDISIDPNDYEFPTLHLPELVFSTLTEDIPLLSMRILHEAATRILPLLEIGMPLDKRLPLIIGRVRLRGGESIGYAIKPPATHEDRTDWSLLRDITKQWSHLS